MALQITLPGDVLSQTLHLCDFSTVSVLV